MKMYRVWKAVKILAFVIVASVAFGFAIMQLWNWLVPAIFGWKQVTFVQAIGLLVLSKILFGGFHRHVGGRPGWKRHMNERWAQMSPEERERFRSGMRGRRGWRCGGADEPRAEQSAS